jgi:class 3 adenylate cyclase
MGYGEMLQEEAEDRGLDDLVPDLEKIQGAARKLLQFLEDVFQTEGERSTAPAESRASPSTPEEADREASESEEEGSLATADGKLLLVDDDAANRDLLSRQLSRAGYQVTAVEDGTRALRAIEAEIFDLVLLDVLMPGMSGLEVLASIRKSRSVSDLPVIMATALGGSEDIVEALRLGSNDYVTKPFDMPVVLARVETQLSLRRAAQEIAALAQQLEIRNAFIRRAFGRYVSDEIVADLLENPEGLEFGGEKRVVTILMSDLRGFSTLTEALEPAQVVSLLNRYLGKMAEVIMAQGGTIDEFIGDAVLAFFGAPVAREDDAERAVAAAVAMQLAMQEVNQGNRAEGLPEIEMGIGISTGEVTVGNIGSEKRAKYGAIGSPVNLAGRIESYTLGGDILVCDTTFREVASVVRAEPPRQVHPKGFAEPISIHSVRGIGGRHDLELPDQETAWVELEPEIAVRYSVLEGKQVSNATEPGSLCALSRQAGRLRVADPLPDLANLCIELVDDSGSLVPGAFYAKVMTAAGRAGEPCLVRFTSRSPALEAALARTLE